jgi:DNA-binding MarR family transcriptional regulator
MAETTLIEQAGTIAALFPALLRQLFTLKRDRAAELPLAQLRVCGILSDGPRPMSKLSRELRVSLSALTQIADRLERAHLVKRVSQRSDRRIKCLQLTRQGATLMRKRDEARVERLVAVLGRLSPQVRQDVVGALETLHTACTAALAAETAPKANGNSRQHDSQFSAAKVVL